MKRGGQRRQENSKPQYVGSQARDRWCYVVSGNLVQTALLHGISVFLALALLPTLLPFELPEPWSPCFGQCVALDESAQSRVDYDIQAFACNQSIAMC